MSSKLIEKCRGCASKALSPAFSLGGNASYVICDVEKDATACGLLQRAETSGYHTDQHAAPVTRTHRHRLRAVVSEAMEMISTRSGAALDIGCGDGTLMSFFPRWVDAYGVDHCQLNDKIKDWGKAIPGTFPSAQVNKDLRKHIGKGGFDVITAISILNEVPDPISFFENVKMSLSHDGIFVMETSYASLALMRNQVDSFHEKAEAIYTLSTLERFTRKAGLKIVRGAMTETDGGGIRLFITHMNYTGHDYVPWLEQLARLWDEEMALDLNSRQTYQAFSHRVQTSRENIESFFDRVRKYNEHAHILGTDERILALMECHDIGGDVISYFISKDDEMIGKRLSIGNSEGTIEVISELESRTAPPDYIIAPSHLRREVLEHWRDSVFEGIQIIFLTPELDIIDENNYGTELGKCLAVTDGPGSLDTLKSVLATVNRPRLVAVNNAIEA